jgi:formate hydrogenlyase subunit 6/NADH:ubiquinone oxidoreductase subunit I
MKRWPGRMAGEVLRHVMMKPATVPYPFGPADLPKDYRGKIQFIAVKCVGCKLCQKDCPSQALVINKVGDKRFEAVFQLDRCIYCAQCVDSCAKHAMLWTSEFELATLDKSTLRIVYHAPDAPPAPAPKPETEAKPAPKAEAPGEAKPATAPAPGGADPGAR